MSRIDSFLADNAQYVAKGELPSLESVAFVAQDYTPNDPKPSFAIVTCMDRRLDPIRALGLEGKAAIIRNAGGVAADALRSLIVFQSLTRGKEIV
ncbi:hypothetical protein PENSPDRAFT_690260 [Peniophora sp. CONT]|nr:hypothetical protein PENSPDRAFT_690260 [Peniophora sp. CONT]